MIPVYEEINTRLYNVLFPHGSMLRYMIFKLPHDITCRDFESFLDDEYTVYKIPNTEDYGILYSYTSNHGELSNIVADICKTEVMCVGGLAYLDLTSTKLHMESVSELTFFTKDTYDLIVTSIIKFFKQALLKPTYDKLFSKYLGCTLIQSELSVSMGYIFDRSITEITKDLKHFCIYDSKTESWQVRDYTDLHFYVYSEEGKVVFATDILPTNFKIYL